MLISRPMPGSCLPGSVFTALRQFEIFFTGDNNSRLVLRLLILCIIAGWLHIRDQEYLRPPGEGSETKVPGERSRIIIGKRHK